MTDGTKFNNRLPKARTNSSKRRSEVVDWLALQSEPVTTEQVARAFGVPRKTINARLAYLKSKNYVECVSRDGLDVWSVQIEGFAKQPKITLRSFNAYSTLEAMQRHTLLLLTGKLNDETVSH